MRLPIIARLGSKNGWRLLENRVIRNDKTAIAALGFLALLVAGALLALGLAALQSPASLVAAFDSYFFRIAGFTIWQAALSTVLSLLPALVVARALYRHPVFFGRSIVLRLMALPLALPALIAALGLLALLGRAGIAAPVLSWMFDTRWPGIYGLGGILLAHVFFNMPLATRLFLIALETIPHDHLRLAAQLGFSPLTQFKLLEWPALKSASPGIALMVFLLCATSFTLVLTLGGGPQATTIEVAIYQALRFDYAPERAVAFALVQLVFAVGLATIASRFVLIEPKRNGDISPLNLMRPKPIEAAMNTTIIAVAGMFVASPLLAIIARGVQADLPKLITQPTVFWATLTSLTLATLASILCCVLAIALLSARSKTITEFFTQSGGVLLSVSPIVIGAGWFIALQGLINPLKAAPGLIVAVNAMMALPFVLRALSPAWAASRARHDRLAASLGITGFTRFKLVEGIALRGPIFAALSFAAALSLGDLGVVALFGSDSLQTLPSLLFARLGSYRSDDAAGLAFLLMLLCLSLLRFADLLINRSAR
jgi:thiamine transport system permease protein